ncbi:MULTISPECIES: DUF2062 domain-containing protein [Paracoccaceae]|uniref:DUF2062 domain-containing protein n=1 Tax=Rhodobacterales TaxID=204455 RepID=UPI001B2DBE35|nr:DUF2062 domain-containing protein [Boseongicola sp. H5]MBO6604639.1 DUF2062 domain-containing protein [Roseicyclus sp.]MBO6624392.1 DUF2062 domain-containing protein [Roseicyclus sp.]MBO6922616.1 DUF2062 domain-containing protein [Roseicyclus sp.]
MVFKRRDNRPWGQVVAEWIYPRGGWTRAFHYIKHRLRRLPGTPESIARGIFAGAFTVFTPFYGLHFIVAAIIAKLMRGNILAALLATFLGNPLTYIPIGLISLQTGHFLLGTQMRGNMEGNLFSKFYRAAGDLWNNFVAMFTDDVAHWDQLAAFYRDVFFPYLVGGVIPGLIAGTVCYYLSVPVIRAYQKRRANKLRAKMKKLREQSGV